MGNPTPQTQPTWLDLYDYRRRVAALYREREQALQAGGNPPDVLVNFRAGKDALFATHPQSALNAEQRASFAGLRYFPYEAGLRLEAEMTPLPPTDEVIQS